MPASHLEQILQHRLLRDLLQARNEGGGQGGRVGNLHPRLCKATKAGAATVQQPAARTTEFQCSVTARVMSSLLLVGCTPCTSYCLVYLRSVWTSAAPGQAGGWGAPGGGQRLRHELVSPLVHGWERANGAGWASGVRLRPMQHSRRPSPPKARVEGELRTLTNRPACQPHALQPAPGGRKQAAWAAWPQPGHANLESAAGGSLLVQHSHLVWRGPHERRAAGSVRTAGGEPGGSCFQAPRLRRAVRGGGRLRRAAVAL